MDDDLYYLSQMKTLKNERLIRDIILFEKITEKVR